MSLAAPNTAAESYRPLTMSYARMVDFLKTNQTIEDASALSKSAKSGKVASPNDIGASQKLLSEPLHGAVDIRRFANQSPGVALSESKSEPLHRADAQAEKAALSMARNARKKKPVFQSDRKPLSLLA